MVIDGKVFAQQVQWRLSKRVYEQRVGPSLEEEFHDRGDQIFVVKDTDKMQCRHAFPLKFYFFSSSYVYMYILDHLGIDSRPDTGVLEKSLYAIKLARAGMHHER
jgi:hypothetical protein